MDAVIVTTSVKIPEDRIEDLLCGAFEGGSTYWAVCDISPQYKRKFDVEYSYQIPLKGGEIDIYDVDEPDQLLGVINEQNLKTGLKLMANGRDKNDREIPLRHFQDFINKNDDAITADVFLQLVVLGELVFG